VEVDRLRRRTVDRRLGLGQPPEEGRRAVLHRGAEGALAEEIQDVAQAAVVVMVRVAGVGVVAPCANAAAGYRIASARIIFLMSVCSRMLDLSSRLAPKWLGELLTMPITD
jgi:hypothetical protein